MACDLLSGIELSCRQSVGGVKNVYILSGSIGAITESSGAITDISGSGTYWKLALNKGVGSFTEAVNVDVAAGTVGYTQTVEMAFPKLATSLRNQVKVLAQAPELSVIVETEQAGAVGKFFLIGESRGAYLSGGTGATGQAYSDANQYALTLEAIEPEPAKEIETATGVLTEALTNISVG